MTTILLALLALVLVMGIVLVFIEGTRSFTGYIVHFIILDTPAGLFKVLGVVLQALVESLNSSNS